MIPDLFSWLGARWRDAWLWPVNLFRDLPRRSGRVRLAFRPDPLPTHFPGSAAPSAFLRLFHRLHRLLAALFDLGGGPELAQFLMHLGMQTSPLTNEEIQEIASVLGPRALRYRDVRIAEGGILSLVFRLNGGRAFATWHTVHLPQTASRSRVDRSLLLHEVTHVFQYEQLGSAYIGEALYAQWRLGMACYHYGGAAGLRQAQATGRRYRDVNREAQAQIAQDYYRRQCAGQDTLAYEPFIAELRAAAF